MARRNTNSDLSLLSQEGLFRKGMTIFSIGDCKQLYTIVIYGLPELKEPGILLASSSLSLFLSLSLTLSLFLLCWLSFT